MRRREFLMTLGAGALVAPLASFAQQAARMPKIGYVDSGSAPGAPPVGVFREGLRELGYVEGQTITVEYRWAEGNYHRLPDLVAELVRLNVDVIFAGTTPAARAATATIPIVIGFVADPVGSGIVASLARPGGNVTGWTHLPGPEFAVKRLEVLKDTVPSLTRVSALWNPGNPFHDSSVQPLRAAARTMGFELEAVGARDADELEKAFSTITKQRPQALYVFPDGMFLAEKKRIIGFTAKIRVPAIYGNRDFPEAGGLISYGANTNELHRRTAYFVDKILKGVKPADLPIERPTRFDLVINMKTAKALGLTIQPVLLLRADRVIE
jgi:putative tryptophan/tyrosine transport system substrate-binding protein